MRVYKCDRCGKYASIGVRGYFVRNIAPMWRIGRKNHLCDDCVKSFRRWMNNPDTKEED